MHAECTVPVIVWRENNKILWLAKLIDSMHREYAHIFLPFFISLKKPLLIIKKGIVNKEKNLLDT
jgi:hypothetical protein